MESTWRSQENRPYCGFGLRFMRDGISQMKGVGGLTTWRTGRLLLEVQAGRGFLWSGVLGKDGGLTKEGGSWFAAPKIDVGLLEF